MNRFVHMVVLAAFLAVGFGVPMAFANEPAPAEQKPSIGCNIKWKPGNEPAYFSATAV